MIFGFEIAMLIGGIIALVQGKVTISGTMKAEGIPARLAGLLMILPLPLAFTVGFIKGMTMGPSVGTHKELYAQFAPVEGAIALCCLTLAILIVHLYPHTPVIDDESLAKEPEPDNYEKNKSKDLPAVAVWPARSTVKQIVVRTAAVSLVLIVAGLGGIWLLWSMTDREPRTPRFAASARSPLTKPVDDPNRVQPAIPPKNNESQTNPLPAGAFAQIVLPNETRGIVAVAYSLDGKIFALGSKTQQAFWYDADSRKLVANTPNRKDDFSDRDGGCAISPLAEKVVFYHHGSLLYFYDRANPRDEVILHPDEFTRTAQQSAAFSPDGKYLCTTHGDQLSRIWDVAERKRLRELSGYNNHVGSTAYSPDGSLLACADTEIFLWHPKTYQLLTKLNGPGRFLFSALAFSSDSKLLAGINERTVYVWEVKRDGDGFAPVAEAREFPHIGWVKAITFSPDSRVLLSAADDGVIRLWDVQTLKKRAQLKLDGSMSGLSLAIRAHDSQLAVGHRNRVLFYDLRHEDGLGQVVPASVSNPNEI